MKRIVQTLALIGLTISLLSVAQNTDTNQKADAVAVTRTEKVVEVKPIEYGTTLSEKIIEVKTVMKPAEEDSLISEDDIELIALVTMAEAEGESELGKRLVIDTILNRMDSDLAYFPDTVYDVIYQKNAFSSVWSDRINRVEATEEVIDLVREEIESRTNYDVMYFRTKHYSNYGTPLLVEGGHYFSSI